VLNTLDAVVVQGEAFRSDLLKMRCAGAVHVIPYVPPACTQLAALPPGPTIHIGFLGRLAAQKNLPYLLEAFSLVRQQLEAQLHLFGDGAERARLMHLVNALKLKESVHLHGQVAPGQVGEVIDSCHLFTFTSTAEGQCLAALEILSRGRPIAATPVGVFPELLADGALGVIGCPKDPAAFAQCIRELAGRISVGDLAPAQVQACFAARFPRDQILDQYTHLLRELASGPAATRET
jgi:glycosyltransferase involved in cell wall biosynthesis